MNDPHVINYLFLFTEQTILFLSNGKVSFNYNNAVQLSIDLETVNNIIPYDDVVTISINSETYPILINIKCENHDQQVRLITELNKFSYFHSVLFDKQIIVMNSLYDSSPLQLKLKNIHTVSVEHSIHNEIEFIDMNGKKVSKIFSSKELSNTVASKITNFVSLFNKCKNKTTVEDIDLLINYFKDLKDYVNILEI